MRTAHERRLVLFYLSNAAEHLQYPSKEAGKLAQWVLNHEEELNLRHPLKPSGDTAKERGRSGNDELLALEWQCLGTALRGDSP